MTELFFYGTLQHLPLLELVLDRPASEMKLSEARLRDHAVYGVKDQAFPMILSENGSYAEGLLVQNLSQNDLERLNFYEGGFDYELRPLGVETVEGDSVQADVYFPDPGLWTPTKLWELRDWVDRWGDISVTAAHEVMGYFGKIDAATLARSFPALRTRAWAKIAARQRGTGDLRDVTKDVVLHNHRYAHVNYFGMEEVALQHRQHDGTMGPVLQRSSLMQGSAVVVLPYDPARDVVLLVEQFRPPVFIIDDPEPWMWEPVAGMIDPGETPEHAARREAQEEAGVVLQSLEYAGGAYSSSGSSTEYIHLYVGLADLELTVQGGGLASEGEDIRSQILPFVDFMDRVDAHGFKDLPLLALAHWLARHRNRLRA